MPNEQTQLTKSDSSVKSSRLFYIDWLRVFALLSIFFFHSDRFFDYWDWNVKNIDKSIISAIHTTFTIFWVMPLFFVLSGASVYYSLRIRKSGEFVKERILRVLIPLLFVGYLIICPPQTYLDRLFKSKFTGSFFQFLPQYFNGFDGFGGNFPWYGYHLWYLQDLFIFSLIFLPLLIISGKSGKSLISRLAVLFEKPWMFFLLFIPLTAADMFTDALGLGLSRMAGGWGYFSYILFFIYGYMFFSNSRIQDTIKKYYLPALIIAVALSVSALIVFYAIKPDNSQNTPLYVWLLKNLNTFCWIIAFLGVGMRFLNFENKFLKYANEAVMPFYIFHQTIIIIIGFFVVQWGIGIAAKFVVIVILSFITIMAIYELLVRRINILRFLFGMKPVGRRE